jgi:hypothetical protein
MTLPYDIARCPGNGSQICYRCRRREPGRDYWQPLVGPMASGEQCPNLITEVRHESSTASELSAIPSRVHDSEPECAGEIGWVSGVV